VALYQTLVASGNRLFKQRSILPWFFFFILMAGMREFHYLGGSYLSNLWWEALCWAVSGLGLVVRCYTIGHAPKGTSGRNTSKQVADTLSTTGIYSLVRNPLYVGNFLMGLGVVMFPHHAYVIGLYILSFWLYYEHVILAEEAFLIDKYGATYTEWAARTPVFVPKLSGFVPPRLPFSFKVLLNKEYTGVFGLVLAFVFLETLGDWIVTGRLSFPLWRVSVFGAAVVLYLTLRTLKKMHITHVEGR
jgi:protein-S-isoprenylcysteine O-methyltransferase Ste14